MDLIYFFKVLFRRKWIILGLSALSVLAAFVFLYNKKSLYISQAQYSTGFTAEKVRLVDGSSGIDIYTADIKFNNAIETFKSPKVINTIAYKLMLHDLKNPTKAYRRPTKSEMESKLYKAVNIPKAIQVLEEHLKNNQLLSSDTEEEKILIEYFKLYGYDYDSLIYYLTIERVGRTDYLNIFFRSENASLSALIVNALGQEFLNYYKNLSSQRTGENAEGIKKIVTAQQDKIDSLGKKLYGEKLKQGSIDPVSLSTSAMETVKELETALAEEKSKQNEHLNRKKYMTERFQFLSANSAGSTSGSNDDIIRLTNRKNDLVAELARKGGADPALEKQISDLRSEINSKSSSGGGNKNAAKLKEMDDLRTKISEEDALLTAANSTIADYSSRIRKYTGMANSAPLGSDVTIEGIKSKLGIENAQLGIVMEKYSQAEGLVKDDPTTNFIQTGVGQPAINPESKKTMLTMALAGLSMFFLSSVIFLFIEIFDPRAKTPTLFKKQVNLPVAVILNNVPANSLQSGDIILNDFDGKKFSKEILFKNSIRKLRYELLKSTEKVFLFTSTQPGTGKSVVIEALASSLLLSSKKVLIIDLNFSNNSLTLKYNPATFIQDLGSKIKSGASMDNQQLWSKTSLEGLSIIGCKPGNFTPSEALSNIDMGSFLKSLQSEFDYILIEGAALNDYADGQEIAAYAGAVMTVFSADDAVTHADEKSIKFLTALGEKNKGAILNNVLQENIDF